MIARLKTKPVKEPMTLQEAKDHLRVDLTDEDAYIDQLITAARLEAEDLMERALITQTWELFLDCFPVNSRTPILVSRPPLISVTTIKYIDAAGAEQTWPAADYKVDNKRHPARIFPAFDKTWPTTRSEANAVTIEYQAGYGPNAQDVPENIRHAIKLILTERYENRGGDGSMPLAASNLLTFYRDQRF